MDRQNQSLGSSEDADVRMPAGDAEGLNQHHSSKGNGNRAMVAEGLHMFRGYSWLSKTKCLFGFGWMD